MTKDDSLISRLPSGWCLTRLGKRVCLHPEADEARIVAAARRFLAGEGTSPGKGRGPTIRLEELGEALIFRPYRHGGMLRFLTGSRFLRPQRFLEEARLTVEAGRRGVAVPAPRGLLLERGPWGWKGVLITTALEPIRDGTEIARGGGAVLSRAAAAGAEAVATLHAADISHADLHLKNILFSHDGGRAWIIDLDRARIKKSGRRTEVRRNLLRLLRSWVKLGETTDLPPGTPLRFLFRYCEKDPAATRSLAEELTRRYWRIRLSQLRWRMLSLFKGLGRGRRRK